MPRVSVASMDRLVRGCIFRQGGMRADDYTRIKTLAWAAAKRIWPDQVPTSISSQARLNALAGTDCLPDRMTFSKSYWNSRAESAHSSDTIFESAHPAGSEHAISM